MLGFARSEGFNVRGLIRSPLLGPKGNAEFLVWLEAGEESGAPSEDIVALIERAMEESQTPE